VTGKFAGYEHRLDDPHSLSDNRVTSVHIDHSGTVWAATESGLDKLNLESGRFTSYYTKDGLPSDRVNCILEDQRGNLWMSTNRGISRFDPVTKTFKNYSTADGLPGMDFTGWLTCFKGTTGSGCLWAADLHVVICQVKAGVSRARSGERANQRF
jgi:ligand-binding sensor domain-containing protein